MKSAGPVVASLALSLVFLGANIVTSDKSPRPWVDEVMFADPGLNRVSGEGFVTRWWRHQTDDEMFVSNSPLFSLLVGEWSRITGPSVVPLRTLNYLLMLISAGVIVLAVMRAFPRTHSFPVLAMVLAVWTGYGMTFSYRSLRYDILCLLLMAVVGLVLTIHRREMRLALLFLLGLCLPLAGLHLLPYAAALGLMILVVDRTRLWSIVVLGLGSASGLLLFIGVVYSHGLFDQLYASVVGLSDHGKSPQDRLRIAGRAVLTDPSSLIVLAGVLGASLVPAAARVIGRKVVLWALFAGLLLPALVSLSGKFPVYYSWMKYVPLCIIAGIALDRVYKARQMIPSMVIILSLLVASYGLIGRTYLSAKHWNSNDSSHLQSFAESVLAPGEHVLATPIIYFSARTLTSTVYSHHYVSNLSDASRSDISLLLVSPSEANRAIRAVGGEWEQVSQYRPRGVSSPPENTSPSHVYHVVDAYRRVPSPSPPLGPKRE